MTQEEKQLLLVDLCARLPYRQKVCYKIHTSSEEITETLSGVLLDYFKTEKIEIVRPYLRPMSSMTEEEFKELATATELQYDQLELMDLGNDKTIEFYLSEVPQYCIIKVFDWLNAHHFDYRGLIPMGLALEAPNNMYNKQ